MKRFRRVLSVAVTLILIVTLFSDSLSAAFISAGPGAADPVNDGIVGTVEGDDLDSADPAGDNSAQTPPEQTGDPSADPSVDPTVDPNVVPSADSNVDPNSGLPNEILGDPVDESLGGEYGINLMSSNGESYNGEQTTLPQPSVSLNLNRSPFPSQSDRPDLYDSNGNIKLDQLNSSDLLSYLFSWSFDPAEQLANKYATFDFNANFLDDVDLSKLSGDLVDGGVTKGKFRIESLGGNNYRLVMEFDSNANNVTGLSVELNSTLKGDPTNVNDGDTFDENFFNKHFGFSYSNDTSELTVTKSRTGYSGVSVTKDSSGGYIFHQPYTITATVKGKAYDFTFTDILSGLENLPEGASTDIHNFSVSYSNPTGQKDPTVESKVEELNSKGTGTLSPNDLNNVTFNGRLYNGDVLTFTYCVDFHMTDEQALEYFNGTKKFDEITNSVNWSYKADASAEPIPGTSGGDDSTKPNFSGFSVSKSGANPVEVGDSWIIDWTVTINLGSITNDWSNLATLLGVSSFDEALAKLGLNNFTDVYGEAVTLYPEGTTLENIFDLNGSFVSKNGNQITFKYQTKIKDDHLSDSEFINTFKYGTDEEVKGQAPGLNGVTSFSKSEAGVDDNKENGALFKWRIDVTVANSKRGQEAITVYDRPSKQNIAEGYTHRIVRNADGNIDENSIIIHYFDKDGHEQTTTLADAKITYKLLPAQAESEFATEHWKWDNFYQHVSEQLKIDIPAEYTFGNIYIEVATEVVDKATGKRVPTDSESVDNAITPEYGHYYVKNSTVEDWVSQDHPRHEPERGEPTIKKEVVNKYNSEDYTTEYAVKIDDFAKLDGNDLAADSVLKTLVDNNSGLTITDRLNYSGTWNDNGEPKELIIKYLRDSFRVTIANKDKHGYLNCDDEINKKHSGSYRVKVKADGTENSYYYIPVGEYVEDLLTNAAMNSLEIDDVHHTFTFRIPADVLKKLSELQYVQMGNAELSADTAVPDGDNTLLGGWCNPPVIVFTQGDQLYISYKTQVDPSSENLKGFYLLTQNGEMTVNNTVTASGAGGYKGEGWADQKIQHKEVLKKEGSYLETDIEKYKGTKAYTERTQEGKDFFDNAVTTYQYSIFGSRNFMFTIEVNPGAEKIGETVATNVTESRIRLEDTLGSSLSVIPDSINVYEYVYAPDGSFTVSPLLAGQWRYRIEETDGPDKFTLDLPDGKHLLVEYWTTVLPSSTTSGGDNTLPVDPSGVTNDVEMSVYGQRESKSSTQPINTAWSTGAMQTADKQKLTIQKFWTYEYDGSDYEQSLNRSGVSFDLYKAKLDDDGNLVSDSVVATDIKSKDSNGKPTGLIDIEVGKADAENTIYCIFEHDLPKDVKDPVDKSPVTFKSMDPIYFVFNCYVNKESLPKSVIVLNNLNTLEIENERQEQAKGSLTLTKSVNDISGTAPDAVFEFTITLTTSSGAAFTDFVDAQFAATGDATYTVSNNVITVELKNGESFTINDLPTGTKYAIDETDPHTELGFVDFTGSVNNGGIIHGDITATAGAVNETWTNDYLGFTPEISKVVKDAKGNVKSADDSFTFNIVETTNGASPVYSDTRTRQGAGTVTFKEDTYTSAGTYTYEITEQKGNNPLVDYFKGTVNLEVKVSKGADGHLTVESSSYTINGEPGSTVTNTYHEAPKADIEFKVSKSITGKDEWDESDKYTIKLTGNGENREVQLTQNNHTVAQSFGKIVYNFEDYKEAYTTDCFKDFVYTISEEEPTQDKVPNTTYDKTEYEVTVHVTFDKATKTLSAAINNVVIKKDGAVVNTLTNSGGTDLSNYTFSFTNTYTKPESPKASLKLGVKKTINGDPIAEAIPDSFTFNLTGKRTDAEPNATTTESLVTLNKSDILPESLTKYFEVIPYDAETLGLTTENPTATFTYTISEVKPASTPAGWEYADPQTVTVTITLKDKDTLEVTVDGKKIDSSEPVLAVEFTNTYTKPKGPVADVEVDVSKKLEGREFGDDDTFVFNITVPDGAPKPTKDGKEIKSLTITKGKQRDSFSLHFDADALGLDSAGKSTKFEYSIVEEHSRETIDGVTYDPNTKLVTVEVTRNAGENGAPDTLEVKVNNSVTNSASFEFTNTYSASGLFTVVAEKKLYNIEDNEEKLVNNITRTFDFKLTATGEKEKEILTRNGGQPDTITINGEKVQAVSKSVSNFGGRIEFKDLKVLPGDISSSPLSFILTEQVGTEKGMEYDTSVKNITVTLEDQGDGTISCSVTPSEGTKDLIFINKYTKPDGSIQFGVTKEITSTNGDKSKLGPRTFRFKLTETTKGATYSDDVDVTVIGGKTTTNYFDSIDYEEEGTHTYTIKELGEVGSDNKVIENNTVFTCDDNVYTVTVKVTYVGGKLVPTIKTVTKANGDTVPTASPMTFTFTNEYNVTEASAVLKVTKDFKGNGKWDAENIINTKYTFNLYKATVDVASGKWSKDGDVLDTQELTYETAKTNPIVTFAEQNNLTVGTYYYIIEEAEISNSNITSSGPIHVTVVVTDNGAGKLVSDVTYNGNAASATITNTFTTKVKPDVKIKKDLKGDWTNVNIKEFTFDLYEVVQEANGEDEEQRNLISTLTISPEDGFTAFENLPTYDKAGTYTYEIVERDIDNPAITKAPNQTFVVKVDYDENGELKVNYPDGKNAFEFTFANTYNASGKFGLKAKKEVTSDDEFTIEGGEFSFTLTADNDAAKALLTKYELDNPLKRSNDSDGNVDFGSFTVDSNDELEFTINEEKGSIPGMKYDNKPHTVVVTFKDDGKGTLTPTITVDGKVTTETVILTITNTYTKPTAETEIKVKKTLSGRDWKTDDKFTFTLTGSDGAPMPDNYAPITITSTTPDKTASFGTIKYTIDNLGGENSKEFTYTVTEDDTNKIPGVVYDASTYTVTVTVTLENGTLTASKSITKNGAPADSIEFTNEFKNTTAHFEATKTVKTVSGNAKTVADYNGKFTFTLKAETENAPMPAKITAANDSEGKVVFGDITYNEPGTYQYLIEEEGGDENGIFYSESVYRATVVVSTAADNSLTASEPTYELQSADGKTYTSAPSAAFENDYTAPYGSLTLNGTKKFAKNTESAAPTINNPLTFVFDVYAEATGSLLYSVPVSVDDISGEYTIEKLLDLNFDESNIGKTYRYKIVERAIDANDKAYAGFAKDNAEYIVEVKVGEPDRYNVITSTYTITKDGEKADDIVFTNTYTALNASTSITVSKNLTGRGWLGGDKFEFTLTSATGEVAKKTVSSADEKAQFDFGPYTIEDVGTYTYTLAETNGGKTIDGVTYDNSKYTVTVEVAYADGKLTATSTIANVTGTNVTFTNKYAASGSFSLTAKKIYKENGSEVEIGDKKFTFGLTSVDNDIISAELTATNNGNNVSFGPFDIPAPGTYKFSLREIVTDPVAGMTYDTEAREITVVATDNNKGGYDITVNGNPAAAENNTGVTFTNEYNYNGFSVTKTVEGTKGVEERETLDFGFKVTLTYNDAPFTGAVKADKEIVSEGDGVYTFTLKHGETVNFSEIPYGVKYFVEETEAHGYTKSAENAEGVIDKDAHEAKFVNFKDKDKVGLSLTKIVTGTDGETERLFNFTITLTQPLTGRYGELEFTEGVAHVAIKSGDTVSVTGLPADIGYTVTEAEANTEDYFTTVVNATSEGIPEGTTAEVVFTNHRDRKLGGLSVSKTVSGTDPDYNKSFNFTVTLNDRSINGMFGQMYFVNGSANITLAHGQTVVADGLPAGVGYTVYEYNSDDFEVSAFGNTGVIPENSYARASFVNTRDKKFGDLSVSKTVDGDEGWDPEQTFEFTVTLSDSTVEGVYGGMTFAGGIAHVVLKAGETATATRLPEGITYTVTEAPVEDFTQSATGDSGVIVADTTASAVFVNTYEAKKLGNLSVTKTVSGDAADMTKVFGFRVILSDAEINGLYGDMYFENGFANIYLSHGQTATAIGLPEGTGYSVIELDSEDYIVTATGTAGFIIADYTVPASFNNHKDQPDIPEVPEEDERHGDDSLAGVGRDRPTGDDSLAGVGMDDMNPATGDYEAESFANGTSAIVILWTMVFLFGAVVIARKRREDR